MYLANACGNTFLVLFDQGPSTWERLAQLRAQNRWRFDTALVLRESTHASVEMHVVEKDGTVSAMCGNGLRAVAAVLDDVGLPRHVRVSTGILTIERSLRGHYRVPMRAVVRQERLHLVEGEPHVVKLVRDVFAAPLIHWGKEHVPFANTTVVSSDTLRTIHARTFERGVNQETASCGTGACAAASAVREARGLSRLQVDILMHGHTLTVSTSDTETILEGSVHIQPLRRIA